jgi:hypothetical protein
MDDKCEVKMIFENFLIWHLFFQIHLFGQLFCLDTLGIVAPMGRPTAARGVARKGQLLVT